MPKKEVVIKSNNWTQKARLSIVAISANLIWYDATVSTMKILSAELFTTFPCFFGSDGCKSSDIQTEKEKLL